MPESTDDAPAQFREQAILTKAAHGRALSARSTLNADERKQQQRRMTELRESLFYRSAALVWHRKALRVMHGLGPDALMATLRTDDPRGAARNTTDSLRHQQQFLFDSVIFHADSLFDYVAHFVSYSFYRSGLRWIPLVRLASDATVEQQEHCDTRISNGFAGGAVRDTQRDFVRRLAKYRGGVIHDEMARGGAGYTFNAKVIGPQGRSDISAKVRVTVPKQFAKRFTIPGYEADPTQATLDDAADWIVEHTHLHATMVLRQLERDLRGEFGDPDATDRVIQMH